MVEILPNISRKDFGAGRAGESAFNIISSSELCYGCGGKSGQTLDYDVFATLEQTPLCNDCIPKVKKIIERDLAKIGRTPSFSINGNGRA